MTYKTTIGYTSWFRTIYVSCKKKNKFKKNIPKIWIKQKHTVSLQKQKT